MKYDEAQNKSPIGVAVYGNIAMKEIVWRKGDLVPHGWFGKYKPLDAELTKKFASRDTWEPLEEIDWKMRLE